MDPQPLVLGERVRDGLGHWYDVVEVLSPWVYRVQPLTPTGQQGRLHPFGTRCTIGRSDLRQNGE